MCGISGIAAWKETRLSQSAATSALDLFFRLSQRRGKEAAGLAVRTPRSLSLFKRPMNAGRMIKTEGYRGYIAKHFVEVPSGPEGLSGPFATIGHARLVTNGRHGIATNNQPVVAGNAVAVHNGIVINDADLWRKHGDLVRRAEVDTEIIPSLLTKFLADGEDLVSATRRLYEEIQGEANIAVLFSDSPALLLATNTGSIYVAKGLESGLLAFASEKPILEAFLKRHAEFASALGQHEILHVSAGNGELVDLTGGGPSRFSLDSVDRGAISAWMSDAVPLIDPVAASEGRRRNLRRCTRCVLPETMPGIAFDAQGVCSHCQRFQPIPLKGFDALKAVADRYRRHDGQPDCVIGLSGGRDSSYGLHVLKKELGLNPIAYTYDWALVTDLARRNQSRLCAKLGVEHVLVSADIQAKRRYIKQNVEAWLHRPELGMVPLFMAGDKMYFYNYRDVARRYGIELMVICGNRFEMTDFKSGFAGVGTRPDTENYRPYNISSHHKLKLVSYYIKNFILNPRYINRSIPDTALGFYASYVMSHSKFTRLYDYIPWDENTIDETLRDEYDWEEASDADTTWRIGDGTAAFYNYIYYTIAGFTEHDTFRSNQIRAGVITRDEALALIERDNQPRFDSIREYANVIGFDLDRALAAIDMAPKLY